MTERLAYYQQRNLEFGEAEAPIKNWLQIKHEIMSLHSPAGLRRRRKRTHATGVHPLSPAVLCPSVRGEQNALHSCARVNPRVSACEPSCAPFLREPSVYSLSPPKANVGHLCKKLKGGMRNGLEQCCNGNFLAIFVEVDLGEKPNFTGRFFGRRRPFDFSTDRL